MTINEGMKHCEAVIDSVIKYAESEIIRKIEDTKSKDKLCEYPYIRCIDIVKEVFGDEE